MGRVRFVVAVGMAVMTCAVAGVMVGNRVKSRREWKRVVGMLKELEGECVSGTNVGRLKQLVDAMAVEMHAGLASDGGSKLHMLLTFVDHLPPRSEKGIYYALDLGGTNFRILRVQLGGRSGIVRHDVESKSIPQRLLTRTSKDLFDFIATSLKEFVEEEDNDPNSSLVTRRALGFAFSFPVKQISVSSGILMKWTKDFSSDMVGKDVCDCLQQAIINKGLNMHVAALVNDTVGTLALGRYDDEDTFAAVIIGTGTNACYIEQADAIIKSQGLPTSSGCMVVNMEWGNFWSSHLPRTIYDIELDVESSNPSEQGFEKLISGMYLGEIVRRVLLRMACESDVFGHVSSSLSQAFALRTPLMSAIHEDNSPELEEVAKILKDTLGICDVSLKVRKLVVNICDVVTRRAARLAAAGIVGILKKMGRDGSGGVTGRSRGTTSQLRRTVVAIEGDLYANYNMFREYLDEAVGEILGQELAPYVVLRVTEDGPGIGAALLAAAYSSDA